MKIRNDPKRGRGVFAEKLISKGETIEVAPVIVVPYDEARFVEQSVIGEYCYTWDDGAIAIALGCASLYNHDPDPNASYESDCDNDVIRFTAIKSIFSGDEITIAYCEEPDEIWFQVEEATPELAKEVVT